MPAGARPARPRDPARPREQSTRRRCFPV